LTGSDNSGTKFAPEISELDTSRVDGRSHFRRCRECLVGGFGDSLSRWNNLGLLARENEAFRTGSLLANSLDQGDELGLAGGDSGAEFVDKFFEIDTVWRDDGEDLGGGRESVAVGTLSSAAGARASLW
jgi:hypothetical protein